ncbi:hypothetical protein V2G26_013099 [Clonostachys chloroleuca]
MVRIREELVIILYGRYQPGVSACHILHLCMIHKSSVSPEQMGYTIGADAKGGVETVGLGAEVIGINSVERDGVDAKCQVPCLLGNSLASCNQGNIDRAVVGFAELLGGKSKM